MTPDEIKKNLGMTDNALDYLEGKQKEVLEGIWSLAQIGEPSDAVKLKALTTMLNKLVPDRTKMELDVKSTAPYETLLKNLEKGA